MRLSVALELPISALDEARLHVSGTKRCPPGPLIALDPQSGKTDAERHRVQASTNGFTVEAIFHGGRCSVAVGAWYDSNGKGSLDTGDYTGETRAILAVDRGLCQGNSVQGPELMLSLVP